MGKSFHTAISFLGFDEQMDRIEKKKKHSKKLCKENKLYRKYKRQALTTDVHYTPALKPLIIR